jgi:diguanylate cyclase (GGDEF)-like protein
VTNHPVPPLTGFGSTIIKIAFVMIAVEILIMSGFYWLGVSPFDWKLALADAALLAIVVAVIAYFGIIRPKDRQILAAIQALAEARLDAEHLARIDSLTGVLSRRSILEALDAELERAKRYGREFSCIMLDLDHFKTFNDTYGHQFGDKVLHRIAGVILEHCRTSDHLGRYGGEEFLIVLPETSLDAAISLAERIRLAVASTPLGESGERVTLSLGVAAWRHGECSASRLISEADLALLKAKAAGRNRTLPSLRHQAVN